MAGRVPTAAEIEAALEVVGMDHVIVDESGFVGYELSGLGGRLRRPGGDVAPLGPEEARTIPLVIRLPNTGEQARTLPLRVVLTSRRGELVMPTTFKTAGPMEAP